MPAKPIFIGGTGSHVGKSWVATALCRYLYRMGHRVAPFKAQNMSNNSMVCPGGGEIGRAQAAQAEACKIDPGVDMNPILLKPAGELGSQVVLRGKPWMNLRAAGYYEHFDELLAHVLGSYARLASQYEYVVVEGAGSVTELNLKRRDLVNLGLALRIQAPVILVADIDRGGVFASVIGTFHLLDPEEASLVRTFMVNKFRGDRSLFAEGVRILEERSGRPCLGVFPFNPEIYLDAEDSLALPGKPMTGTTGIRAAVVRFPHISNFTDFRLLPDAVYLSSPVEEKFDAVFLPGTKNTIDDWIWLQQVGLDSWIRAQMEHGATIVGVCGGFQMLGDGIHDPDGVESARGSVQALGLIRAQTTLQREKTTRSVYGRTAAGHRFRGYEIHMGKTTLTAPMEPFAVLEDGSCDGVRLRNVIGTYCHGALEDSAVLSEIAGVEIHDRGGDKDAQYDRLADWLAGHMDEGVLESLLAP